MNLLFLGPSDLLPFQSEFLEPGEGGPGSALTRGLTSHKLPPSAAFVSSVQ